MAEIPKMHRYYRRFAKIVRRHLLDLDLVEGSEIVIAATGFMTHTALLVAKTLVAHGIDTKVVDIVSLIMTILMLFLGKSMVCYLFNLEEDLRGERGRCADATSFECSW